MIQGDPSGKHTVSFPDGADEPRITASVLTEHFLIYGSADGGVVYYALEDRSRPNEYRHMVGIKALLPNTPGTRLVVVDEANAGWMYNPVDSTMMASPG